VSSLPPGLPPGQFPAFKTFARARRGYARAVRTAAQVLAVIGWFDPLGRPDAELASWLGVFGTPDWYKANLLLRDRDAREAVWLNQWCARALANFYAAARTAAPRDPSNNPSDEGTLTGDVAGTATSQANPEPKLDEPTPTPQEALADYLKTARTPSWSGFHRRYIRRRKLSGLPGFTEQELRDLYDAKKLPINFGGPKSRG
jgi:hypothetical protein